VVCRVCCTAGDHSGDQPCNTSSTCAKTVRRERALGSRRIPTMAIVVQPLDPAWLVEIEAIAVA
jgi:hypothetical protein